MHPYIESTKYAVENTIHLIAKDEDLLRELEHRQNQSLDTMQRFLNYIQAGVKKSAFGENVTDYFEAQIRENQREVERLRREISLTNVSIQAKTFSINSLWGAILQIAKQGISIVHNGLDACPNGRNIGNDTLKNIVWQARNQSMHFEAGAFNPQVTACFQNLADVYGEQFSLNLHPR